MKRRWYLIPVGVFVVSVITAGSMAYCFKRDIRQVIETAAANGWPVVAFTSPDSWFPYGIYTLDGKSGFLVTQVILDSPDVMFFGSDSILYIGASNWSTNGELPLLYKTALPDFRPRPVVMKVPLQPGLYGWTQWVPLEASSRFLYGSSEEATDSVEFLDPISGEAFIIEFKSRSPWSTAPPCCTGKPVWTDGSVIFFHEVNANPSFPPGIDPSLQIAHTDRYWRYDVPSGLWTLMAERAFAGECCVSEDGRVLGLNCHDYQVQPMAIHSEFIDSATGQVLHRVDDAYAIAIGNRWAVCAVGTLAPVPSGPTEACAYDMANNWERHEIPIPAVPSRWAWFRGLAVYEPSAGGPPQAGR